MRPATPRIAIVLVVAAASWAVHTQDRPTQPSADCPAAPSALVLEKADTIDFTTDEGTWMSLDVSPDGKTIVFDLLGDLYTLPITGGAATRIVGGMSFESQPKFSPDGRSIAFLSDWSGVENLWVADADGSHPRAVSKDKPTNDEPEEMCSPSWTPDGLYILVSKMRAPERTFGVFLYDRNGGTGIRLGSAPPPPPGDSEGPRPAPNRLGAVASPDSRFVYHAQRMGRFSYNAQFPLWQVHRFDRETGDDATITSAQGSAMRPVLSPDGRWLVYATRFDTQTGLRLRNVRTGDERWLIYPVTRDDQESVASRDTMPGYAFLPDGKSLVVPIGGKIQRIDVETGHATPIPFTAHVQAEIAARVLFENRIDDGPTVRAKLVRWPAVSPDGERVAFSSLGKILDHGPAERDTAAPHQPGGRRVHADLVARRPPRCVRDLVDQRGRALPRRGLAEQPAREAVAPLRALRGAGLHARRIENRLLDGHARRPALRRPPRTRGRRDLRPPARNGNSWRDLGHPARRTDGPVLDASRWWRLHADRVERRRPFAALRERQHARLPHVEPRPVVDSPGRLRPATDCRIHRCRGRAESPRGVGGSHLAGRPPGVRQPPEQARRRWPAARRQGRDQDEHSWPRRRVRRAGDAPLARGRRVPLVVGRRKSGRLGTRVTDLPASPHLGPARDVRARRRGTARAAEGHRGPRRRAHRHDEGRRGYRARRPRRDRQPHHRRGSHGYGDAAGWRDGNRCQRQDDHSRLRGRPCAHVAAARRPPDAGVAVPGESRLRRDDDARPANIDQRRVRVRGSGRDRRHPRATRPRDRPGRLQP